MDTSAPLAALRAFRRDLYSCFSRRADAVFELVDAILAAEAIPSLPHLSLAALHRRGWGSDLPPGYGPRIMRVRPSAAA